jgi:hypothetical protein
MTRVLTICVALTIALSACGGPTSAGSCTEYAAQIREVMNDGIAGEELAAFVEDTSGHAARLIQSDPDAAQPCVDAILEATFSAAFEEIESLLD